MIFALRIGCRETTSITRQIAESLRAVTLARHRERARSMSATRKSALLIAVKHERATRSIIGVDTRCVRAEIQEYSCANGPPFGPHQC